MKGKGWFELWVNAADVLPHGYVECFKEQMSLVFDPAINDYRNLASWCRSRPAPPTLARQEDSMIRSLYISPELC
nr:unnamed protein product [Digitaria exilis]